VTLFGPTAPSVWGPTIDLDRHTVFWSGRSGDPHGYDTDPGLLEIDPEDVAAATLEQARSARMQTTPILRQERHSWATSL
jgi:hypothetical protein